jgi:hypothetical protein
MPIVNQAGARRFIVIYDYWCYKQNCENYIDWQFSVDGYEQPYDCTSCKLQGQSYNITEIAKDCPHKERASIEQQLQPDTRVEDLGTVEFNDGMD